MYLIPQDYKKQIQTDNLNQIIANDSAILTAAENTGIEEASSYLKQKYDLSQELTDTRKWDKTVQYGAADRVYLTADAYDTALSYAPGSYVVHNGAVYVALVDTTAGPFDPVEWKYISLNYQIFYARYPQPLFDLYTLYRVGDQVFYKGKVYTCAIASTPQSFPANIQDQYYELRALPNVFPDDPNRGVQYWGNGVAYSVPGNTAIENTAYWTLGDNRSQQLVTYIIDLTLYHVHSRIAPRNIPDLRVKRYDDAIRWFKNAAKGEDVTANLPRIQPTTKSGARIRWGGHIKNQNTY